MTASLNIIVSCTDRKRAELAPARMLRSIGGSSIEKRAAVWSERLNADGARVRARDLYGGEHWVCALELADTAERRGFKPTMWVASAGYGLVSAEASLLPYSATFAPGEPDSVAAANDLDRAAAHRRWWAELAKIRKSPVGFVEHLAIKNPRANFMVVASPHYLEAMEDDLSRARMRLVDADQLALVSSAAPDALSPSHVHSNERLLGVVGGSRIGLHCRVAKMLLSSGSFSSKKYQQRAAKAAQRAPAPVKFERTPLSDSEVRSFIARTEVSGWSTGLRALRESGQACEQKRFKRLFLEERA